MTTSPTDDTPAITVNGEPMHVLPGSIRDLLCALDQDPEDYHVRKHSQPPFRCLGLPGSRLIEHKRRHVRLKAGTACPTSPASPAGGPPRRDHGLARPSGS